MFVIKRFLISVPLLLFMSFIAFFIIHMAPGNYFDSLKLNPQISRETIERYEAKYHFDKPVIIQYLYWVGNFTKGDLGYSFSFLQPVSKVILGRLKNTLILSITSIFFVWLIALPLGIITAVKHNKFFDRIITFISYIGVSIPSFLFALLLLYAVSVTGVLPLGGLTSPDYDRLNFFGKIWDISLHLIIPVLAISLGSIASLMRITRGNMLDALREQYIVSARARGLSEKKIVYSHALRNAINPLITLFGYELSGILSGAALIEIITNYPGIGSIMLQAVRTQDIFLVMGSMMVGGCMLIVGNLIADILLRFNDPRIKY